MKFVFLGAYDPAYPRNAVIRKGLESLGDEIAGFPVNPSFKAWMRYPILLARLAANSFRSGHGFPVRRSECVFVPEFCQKDVPLGRFLATLTASPLVFDPLAARYETKVLDWKRRSPGSPGAWWNFRIDDWAFRLSDVVLADTAAHAAYYRDAYRVPMSRIGVVPVGYDDSLFDPDRVRPAPKPRNGRPFVVLFIGSFLPLHGVEAIVKAARIVKDRDSGIIFRFVGSGQTRPAAESMAADLGADNCVFEPWAAYEDLPAIIADSDACLGIFGRTEKAGRVVPHKVYQCLGMRKPVITARTPAAEEFLIHGGNSLLCDEPLAENLAEAVLALKKDAALGERIARNGHLLARKKFTPPAVARKLKTLLAGAMDRGKREPEEPPAGSRPPDETK
jgi:glycosyltransferase involved in cell wall biosynthesis